LALRREQHDVALDFRLIIGARAQSGAVRVGFTTKHLRERGARGVPIPKP
jgi:hypothetical protein